MSSSNRTNIPNSLNEHWMPFTDNKSFKKNPRLITDAKGVYLTNHQGKKMIIIVTQLKVVTLFWWLI